MKTTRIKDSPVPQENHGTVANYVIGFVSSIILTLLAYTLVVNQVFSGWNLAYAIIGLALIQLIVQLRYFLHLGQESEPRWNLLLFDFMLIIVVIVVIGSIWIMQNLHSGYNDKGQKSSPQEIERELLRDENLEKRTSPRNN